MEADPIEATEIGDRRFDDRMPDLTPAAYDREMARLRELRARVAAVDPHRLVARGPGDAGAACWARSTRIWRAATATWTSGRSIRATGRR